MIKVEDVVKEIESMHQIGALPKAKMNKAIKQAHSLDEYELDTMSVSDAADMCIDLA